MIRRRVSPPKGYVRVEAPHAKAVAVDEHVDAVRRALASGTLYAYAERHAKRRELRGRGIAWAVPLPDGPTVVIRRSRHGGLLAPLTGERFLGSTRAPRELEVSLRLTRAGVPTPRLVAYAVYPAGPLLSRADVATEEIPRARDLGESLAAGPRFSAKRLMIDATARLIVVLGRAGARHPDLNLKNVLLAPTRTGRVGAWALDVDRVTFGVPGDPAITEANLERLERSARKWREQRDAPIGEEELRALRVSVARQSSART